MDSRTKCTNVDPASLPARTYDRVYAGVRFSRAHSDLAQAEGGSRRRAVGIPLTVNFVIAGHAGNTDNTIQLDPRHRDVTRGTYTPVCTGAVWGECHAW
jgi:hypothetical protein